MSETPKITIAGVEYPAWVVNAMALAEIHYRAEVPAGKRKNRDDKWRDGLARDFERHSYPRHLNEHGELARIRNAFGPAWLNERWPDLEACPTCGGWRARGTDGAYCGACGA